ncbi:hypothetical protein OSTOST_23133, partial [Ostertagia ostertagi]
MTSITYALLLMTLHVTSSLDNGLARTPPMGWMSWAAFYCQIDCESHPDHCINEKLYQDMADRMVTDGFLAAGYNRVHIDDCLDGKGEGQSRSTGGGPSACTTKVYNLESMKTMERRHAKDIPEIDAETFASWDVDYLKLDGCNVNTTLMPIGYPKMERALNGTGRPIVYACGWPFLLLQSRTSAVRAACNSWRIYEDVAGNWNSISDIIRFVNENQDMFAAAQGPCGWNDPDMVIYKQPSLPNTPIMSSTTHEPKVLFTRCRFAKCDPGSSHGTNDNLVIWSAPLIMSNDLRVLKQEFRDILLNRDVIAIDQDPLGIMGKLVR